MEMKKTKGFKKILAGVDKANFKVLFIAGLLFLFATGFFMVNVNDVAANEKVVAGNKVVVFKIDDFNYYLVDLDNDKVDTVRMDTAPKIYPPGRTFVPVRFLGNALGIDDNNITWQANTQTAILKGNKTLKLQINNKIMHSNDKPVQMDVAPLIQHPGRTMLPARYVAEGLGYIVEWDAQHQAVIAYMDNGEKPDIAKALEMVKQVEPPKPPKNGARVYSEADLTPEMVQKIRSIYNHTEGRYWSTIEPQYHSQYAEAIKRDFMKIRIINEQVPNITKVESIVVSDKLYLENGRGAEEYRVIVNGNQIWDVTVGFTGKEFVASLACFKGFIK